MTTDDMNTLDRQVAELMGIPIMRWCEQVKQPHFRNLSDGALCYHDGTDTLVWQPTRDPRCERIVVEWLIKQKRVVTATFYPGGQYVTEISEPGSGGGGFLSMGDTPGIALCLAVVEAFGGENRER